MFFSQRLADLEAESIDIKGYAKEIRDVWMIHAQAQEKDKDKWVEAYFALKDEEIPALKEKIKELQEEVFAERVERQQVQGELDRLIMKIARPEVTA